MLVKGLDIEFRIKLRLLTLKQVTFDILTTV